MTGGCSEYCRITINYSADTKKTSEFLRALAEAGIETHALCGSFGKKNRLTFTTRAANVAAALRSVALLNTDGKNENESGSLPNVRYCSFQGLVFDFGRRNAAFRFCDKDRKG